ncbi:MAG: lytic transglycosylase domain-containing protein [Deltaproteobacteria bacterium]|nr:lytic transglycosylase domain-containing protein [Deltaproteobacteria bacterium]
MRLTGLILTLFAGVTPAHAAPSVRALVETATATPGLERLRAAREALDAGEPAIAAAALKDYAGPLPDYAAFLAVRAGAPAHEAGVAGPGPASDVRSGPGPQACPVAPDPRLEAPLEARAAALAATAPAEAAALLMSAPADGARLDRAAGWFRAAKEEARALEAERRLLVEVPESPEAKALAARLGPAAVATRLDERARLARIRTLLEAHENEAALAEAQALAAALGPTHATACELGYVQGKALRKLRRYRPALKALEAARLTCQKTKALDTGLRVALLEVQVRGILGQARGVKLVADWIRRTAPDHSYADDALFVAAEVLARKEGAAAGRAAYQALLKDFPKGDQASTAAWRLALEALMGAKPEEARPYLEQILAGPVPRPVEHARARYWLAQLDLAAGKEAEAKAGFEAIVLQPSFYGWLALDRLREARPAWVAAWQERLQALRDAGGAGAPASALGPAAAAVTRAAQLTAVGAEDWAEAELASVACGGDMARNQALAEAADLLGFHRQGQMLLRAREGAWRHRGPVTDVAPWRLAYSRPYATEVAAAAKGGKVAPLFLWALAREESTFDPEIVSWAGATGLAQLMPATAVGAYADVFGGRLDMSRLTDPALNLRLGAHVLGQGQRKFHGAEALALAAYNGGPGLARRFIPDAPVPFDLWVETLTVKETRRYVKRVLETWAIYRWLYDAEAPFVRFPESVGGPKWR